MNKIGLVGVIMTILIGVILIGSVLSPSITNVNDMQNTKITNTGSNTYFYTVDGDDDYQLVSDPVYTNFTINGEKFNLGGSGTLLNTDQCRVTKSGHYLSLYDVTGERSSNVNTQNYLIIITYTASTKVFTYDVYSGLTVESGIANTYSYNIEKNIIYMNPKGDYVAISNNQDDQGNYPTYYINNLNQIAAGGAYTTGELDTAYFSSGSTVSVGNTSYTGSATATTTPSDEYTDVMSATAYTVTITDGTNEESFVPFTTYVPKTIEGHTTQDNTFIGLTGIIVVLFVIVLFVVAVRSLVGNRD